MARVLLLTIAILVLVSCNTKTDDRDNILVPEIIKLEPSGPRAKSSTLFAKRYRCIPLETTPTCLVGMVNKIVKRDGLFYILSDDQKIQLFDQHGKHVSTLENLGRAPGEYTYIGDFDVYTVNGKKEIWLCDYNTLKIYDASTLQPTRSINYPFVINKFRRTTDGHVLLMTGQNQNVITLSDPQGQLVDSCASAKITNVMFKPLQFIPYKDRYIYQFDLTNSCMIYHEKQKTLQQGFIVHPDNHWLTELQYDALFEKYEYAYFRYIKNYPYVKTFRYFNDHLYLVSHDNDKRYLHILSPTGQQTVQFSPAGNIDNDIFSPGKNLDFISTLNMGDSDNSILLLLQPSTQEILRLNTGGETPSTIAKINDDANPVIIEYY